MLSSILLALGFTLFLWILVRTIKTQPQLFSKDNLGKSFSTMGVLALILILILGLTIMILRQSH